MSPPWPSVTHLSGAQVPGLPERGPGCTLWRTLLSASPWESGESGRMSGGSRGCLGGRNRCDRRAAPTKGSGHLAHLACSLPWPPARGSVVGGVAVGWPCHAVATRLRPGPAASSRKARAPGLPTPRGRHRVDLAFCMDAADPVSGCPRCFERQATRPLIQSGQERGPGYAAAIGHLGVALGPQRQLREQEVRILNDRGREACAGTWPGAARMQNSVLRAAGHTEETNCGASGPSGVGADRAPAGTRHGPGSPTENPGRGPGEAARGKCVPRSTQHGHGRAWAAPGSVTCRRLRGQLTAGAAAEPA